MNSISPTSAKIVRLLAATATDSPTEADRQPSHLVPSEHEVIDGLAKELSAGDNADTAALAAALTSGVYERVRQRSMARRPASALEAARTLEADQLSRSLLLTALLRNRGLAARLVLGLRASPESPTEAAFHVWTEVWLDDHWHGFDPATGTTIDGGYLSMRVTSLTEPDVFAVILPVMENIAKLRRVLAVD
ncbi:MAG: transglutaminase domain-containing protein [Pirellulaceae bacterium]